MNHSAIPWVPYILISKFYSCAENQISLHPLDSLVPSHYAVTPVGLPRSLTLCRRPRWTPSLLHIMPSPPVDPLVTSHHAVAPAGLPRFLTFCRHPRWTPSFLHIVPSPPAGPPRFFTLCRRPRRFRWRKLFLSLGQANCFPFMRI